MRVFAAYILVFALLAQNCSRFFIVLDFEINREYIAKNLCINKAKPKSCCKGSCYLKKKLDKADKEDTPANNSNNKDRNEVLFFAEIKHNHIYNNTITISRQKYSIPQNSDIPQNLVDAVFHPPQA